ncbi:sulfotransferase family 2 domain-containing protein [Demequina subtropica]|uniref:sulfotransferase family 2 domain-containing protein n=1 Tax=Demequina subtropica TaxID=1638989 RepID=UPI0007809384|nr:sulfotransferase family 2 domain-containing protein [Demequina subtropica]
MPIFRTGDTSVLFLHIPKTGGTSIERAFEAAGWNTELRDGRSGKANPNWVRRVSPQHFHTEVLESWLMFERFDAIFTVVRDPLRRFVSDFIWSMRNDKTVDTSAAALEVWAEKTLRRAIANPWVLDNHMRPQVEYLHPLAHVHKFEDGLGTAMERLRAATGFDVPTDIKHSLESSKIANVRSADIEISDRVKQLVSNFYREDYRVLGYEPPFHL